MQTPSGNTELSFQKSEVIARRIRDIQDRLTSVKLMNQTLKTCKQHLQCVNLLALKENNSLLSGLGSGSTWKRTPEYQKRDRTKVRSETNSTKRISQYQHGK